MPEIKRPPLLVDPAKHPYLAKLIGLLAGDGLPMPLGVMGAPPAGPTGSKVLSFLGPRAAKAGKVAGSIEAAGTDITARLKRMGYLGFDTAAEAKQAILKHPDWEQRWQVDTPDDATALNNWKTLVKQGRAPQLLEHDLDEVEATLGPQRTESLGYSWHGVEGAQPDWKSLVYPNGPPRVPQTGPVGVVPSGPPPLAPTPRVPDLLSLVPPKK